jgi:hypothetical protein
MSEEDLVGALNLHYTITIQRSLISGNIKTTQDAIRVHLLGKPDALEEHVYRKPYQSSERQYANRPQNNQQGDIDRQKLAW